MLKKVTGLLALLSIFITPLAAHADAGDFLKSLEGKYVGRGTATIGLSKKTQRVSCKISNNFSQSKSALTIVGNCASTQGKRKVSGRISHSGDAVTGALLSATRGYQVTKSSGYVKGNKMVISVSLMDTRLNKLVRGQQILVKSGNGFKSTVYRFDNKSKKFETIGEMSFKQK